MATHSSVLAWRIPGMGEPGGLPSMGSHRVGHDWSDLAAVGNIWGFPGGIVLKNPPAKVGDTRDSSSIPGLGRSPGGGNGNPLQYSFLENPMDRGAWRATVHGVTKSGTWLSTDTKEWTKKNTGNVWVIHVTKNLPPCHKARCLWEADFVIFEPSISLVVSPPHFVFVTCIPSSLRACLISSKQDHHQSLKDKLPGKQSEVLTTQTAFPPKP